MENKAVIFSNKVVITYNDKEYVFTGYSPNDDDYWGKLNDEKDFNIIGASSFGTVNDCGWDVVLYDVRRESDGHLHCDTSHPEVLPTYRSYRTHGDTQIFKEWDGVENNAPTDKEWKIIEKYIGATSNYKSCEDNANGYFAISFSDFNQETEDITSWGDSLVSLLNEECEKTEGASKWYLGDPYEEYVFVY